MNLIEAWLADLSRILDDESLTASGVRVGVFYTATQLSSGHVGVAFTPRGLTDTVCCPQTAGAAPAAGRMVGQDAWTLAGYALSPVPLRRAVGVAVLNALSSLALEEHGVPDGEMLFGVDALEAAEIQPEEDVAMVGAFIPFIKALRSRPGRLWVVDKHREALKPDEAIFWRPPEQAGEVLSQANAVIITGSSLVEGGIDDLLKAVSGARKVILAGPTASPWPPPFFERGVSVLGGIRVLDGGKILQLVSEAGSGYFFGDAAEKVCLVRRKDALDVLVRVAGEPTVDRETAIT
ncbi:MAG: Rossmann-like domain-containing protein [Nitrospinota bacterium]